MSEWISVKDRLPYNLFDVLLWIVYAQPHDYPGSLEPIDTQICVGSLKNDGWHIYMADHRELLKARDPFGNIVMVTHWMPLPDPPEEVTP